MSDHIVPHRSLICYDSDMRLFGSSLVWHGLRTRKLLVVLIGLLPFVVLTFATNFNPGNDDGWFREHSAQYGLAYWVEMRYETWSGRITAETFTYVFAQLPVDFWRAVSIAIYALLVLCIYKYYTLLVTRRSKDQDLLALALCAVAPFFIGVTAILGGAFWISGSFNYLWIAALGAAAFYPVFYVYVKRELPAKWLIITGIISSVLAGFGQEQVYLLLIGFTALVVVALFWQTRLVWLYPAAQLAITLASATVSYFAPGNKLRMESEIATWLPTFQTAPLADRLEWSLRWFMDATINHFGFLFILSWLLIIALIFAKAKLSAMSRPEWVIVLVLTAALFAQMPSPISQYLFDFNAQWGVVAFSTISYIAIAFWVLVLTTTIFGLYRISKLYLKHEFVLLLLGLGALAATAIVTLSPTMYASEQRTLFVPGVLLVTAIVLMVAHVLREYHKRRQLMLAILFLAFVFNFLALAAYKIPALQTTLGG